MARSYSKSKLKEIEENEIAEKVIVDTVEDIVDTVEDIVDTKPENIKEESAKTLIMKEAEKTPVKAKKAVKGQSLADFLY